VGVGHDSLGCSCRSGAGNQITQWMIRFPSGDKRDGGLLGLGFGGGERIHNPLGLSLWWLELVMEGAVAEMLRSMMTPSSSGAEALTWLMPARPIADKGVTPFVWPQNRPRPSDLTTGVKCAGCGGEGSIGLYNGSVVAAYATADVPTAALMVPGFDGLFSYLLTFFLR
jgi:hypothetical protein